MSGHPWIHDDGVSTDQAIKVHSESILLSSSLLSH
jgi:hypothetical protein